MKNQQLVPPTPQRQHPLLGSLPTFARSPLRFFRDLALLGDISSFRLLRTHCFFLNHPTYIKHVLQDTYQQYGKGTRDFKTFRSVLGNGLLVSEGDFWLRQRRLMQPAFHRKQILAFGQMMTQTTETMLERWYSAPENVFDIWSEMKHLAIQIVGKALLDVDFNHSAIGNDFAVLEDGIVQRFQSPLPLPTWVPTPQNRRLTRAQQALHQRIDTLIMQRRSQNRRWDDLLSMLLDAQDEDGNRMSDAQLHDEATTLLFAGHETTAAALTWVWYLLAKYPDVEQQLHHELDSVLNGHTPTTEDISRLPYTRMVIDETLRLWPPAFMANRRSLQSDRIGDYPLARGTVVFMSPFVMHRHPDYWPNPSRFDPLRFGPEQGAQRPKFAYFPFGGGPHQCIGNTFALTEILLVVATIASRYRLRLLEPDAHIEIGFRPALTPKNATMILSARQEQRHVLPR